MTAANEKLGPGHMVLVVGPSGAGKDTLLGALQERLASRQDIHFARRAITRSADVAAEDHDTLTLNDFRHLVETGNVALAWEAHGLGYIIPSRYDDAIRQGDTVIANGSRRALSEAIGKYQNVTVLLITAPIEILADRLAERGRESREDIKARLNRANLDVRETENVLRIENTGTVGEAVDRIIRELKI